MTHITKQFVVADPRTFDGNCFEVADRAIAQTEALVALAAETAGDARIMARNSELERQPEPDAIAWDTTAEARRWDNVAQLLTAVLTDLKVLRRVASYNPKHPPRA